MFQEFEGFLVHVDAFVGCLKSFLSANGGFSPYIGDSNVAVKLRSHPGPVFSRARAQTVKAEIRFALRVAMQVGVSREKFEGVRWREVPQVALGKIFAGSGVLDATGGVGFVQRKSAAFPFGAQPLFEGFFSAVGSDCHLSDVLDTDFGDDRKSAEGLAVGVAGDMSYAFVPYMARAILPAMIRQYGVDIGPTNFGVPEPQGGFGQGAFSPERDVREIPFREGVGRSGVSRETAYAVRPV